MTVLDAQAIVALLTGERAAQEVAGILRDPERSPSISAINLAEVVDVLVRIKGHSGDEVGEKLEWLAAGGLETIAVDEALGLAAGRLHAKHYDRSRRPLSMADCVALALALDRGEPLATADPALAATAVEEGAEIVGIPNSSGKRPSA